MMRISQTLTVTLWYASYDGCMNLQARKIINTLAELQDAGYAYASTVAARAHDRINFYASEHAGRRTHAERCREKVSVSVY